MVNLLGQDIPLPEIGVGGFLNSTWVYVGLVMFIGLILIFLVAVLLFYKTYNKKVIIFENISGLAYQPVLKTRARVIKIGSEGYEVLKTFAGGTFLPAYGRKMGKNTYWFAKGKDGFLYNFVLGDLDTKQKMLDIEPVERDVRGFHVALDRLSHETYGKGSFLEKYGTTILGFLFLIVMILGMWFLIGQIGDATESLSRTAETNLKVLEKLEQIESGNSGLQPAATIILPIIFRRRKWKKNFVGNANVQ